jgi:hypothetical protein
MAQKMTLSAYLVGRGKKAKALTKIEADVFGIPYPLLAGWPRRHGAMEITEEMIEEVGARAAAANESVDKKARRNAKRASAALPTSGLGVDHAETSPTPGKPPAQPKPTAAPLFPGFILQPGRRHRARKPAPWS